MASALFTKSLDLFNHMQECIITSKANLLTMQLYNVMDQDYLPTNVIMTLIFPQGLWTSPLAIALTGFQPLHKRKGLVHFGSATCSSHPMDTVGQQLSVKASSMYVL